jgi:biotin carboxyl carrier protein
MNEFIVTINNEKIEIKILNETRALINQKEVDFRFYLKNKQLYLLRINNKLYEITAYKADEEKFIINIEGENYLTEIRTNLQEKAKQLLELKHTRQNKLDVKAPMPGMILKIKKNPGDDVEAGEPVLILEAMKMENEIRSPINGKIKNIHIKEGSPVEKGATLFSIG